MRILVNALGATKGGALRHITNFVPKLGIHDVRNEYVLLVRDSVPVSNSAENIQLERVPDRDAEDLLKRLAHDVLFLPARLRREGFDLAVSLTNFGPVWCSVPHVLFQRNSVYYFPLYLSRVNLRRKAEVLLRRALANESMKRASMIVTPSRSMAQMIRSVLPNLKEHRFRTLYHGFEADSKGVPLDSQYVRLFLEGPVRLLYPTHAAPHKGFEILFKALRILKDRHLDFVLYTTVIEEDWRSEVLRYFKQIARLGIKRNVVFLGQIPQKQMAALYRCVDVMVYPSLTESFGFPMLEAMVAALPIVAADTSVNREICGDAALYYPALDASEAADNILRALEPSYKQALCFAASNRMRTIDWSWDRYAKEFVSLLDTVVQ